MFRDFLGQTFLFFSKKSEIFKISSICYLLFEQHNISERPQKHCQSTDLDEQFPKIYTFASLQPLRKKLRPREEEQVNEEDIRLNSRALQVFDSFCFETALQSRFCYLSVFCGLFTSNSILMPKNIEYNPIMVYSSTF